MNTSAVVRRPDDIVPQRCPDHVLIQFVMKCPRCSRKFWEHCDRIVQRYGHGAPQHERG